MTINIINSTAPKFNNHTPSSHIDKIKALSDAKNECERLTIVNKKRSDGIKSRACFAYDQSMERKFLRNAIKEVWEH